MASNKTTSTNLSDSATKIVNAFCFEFTKDCVDYAKNRSEQIINSIINQSVPHHYYIGVAHNSKNRIHQHKDVKNMFIIAKTNSPKVIQELEEHLISKHRGMSRCTNKAKDSLGVDKSKRKYYLYLIIWNY